MSAPSQRRQIYKYEVEAVPYPVEIELPEGAEILHFGHQGEKLYLWALIDRAARKVTRAFQIFGTGWAVYSGNLKQYIGTTQVERKEIDLSAQPGEEIEITKRYVWHLYEVWKT